MTDVDHEAFDFIEQRCARLQLLQVKVQRPTIVPPHGHQWAMLRVVTRGAIAEHTGEGWRDCGRGSVRLSRGGAFHTMAVVEAPFECLLITTVGIPSYRDAPNEVYAHDGHSAQSADELLFGLMRAEDPLQLLEVAGQALELVAASARRGTDRDVPKIPAWLRDVRKSLERSFAEPIDLAGLSSVAGVHPASLSRAFHARYGRTMKAFRRECRLATALRSLRHSDHPIARIAVESGFADHAHLSRVTRQYFGLSPSRLRSPRLSAEPPTSATDHA